MQKTEIPRDIRSLEKINFANSESQQALYNRSVEWFCVAFSEGVTCADDFDRSV